jgi:hypothetical protein
MSDDKRGNASALAWDAAGIVGFLAGALVFSAAALWTADGLWRLHTVSALEEACRHAELSPVLELKEPTPTP